MEYFFDASAGVNFGGDFDFAPSGGASMMTSSTLPDFAGPSPHLDNHHHNHSNVMSSSSPHSFYGTPAAPETTPTSLSSGFAATSIVGGVDDAGSRSYSPSNEAFASSASTIVCDGAAPSTSAAASSMLPNQVSSSSLSASSNHESPAVADSRHFHDASSGANREGSSSSLSSANIGVKNSASSTSSSFPSSSLLNNDSNSDSGVVSSSSSTSCANEPGANSFSSKGSPDEAVEEEEAVGEEQLQAYEEPTIDININNVVCSFSVRCHLNLRKVAMEACNTEYNKSRACVKMKLRNPKITASIWNSGKITCIGATSEDDSKRGARRVARILMNMGFNVHFCRFRVVNVLASCTMPFAIRLHKFSARYPRECEYEPELHPAATYRIKHPKATLKIFSTGSITITAPLVSHISPSVEHIYPRVAEFRMDEKDKESGEMANLVPKAFVPLNTKHGRVKHIPKGPFHSKFKQVIHQQGLVKKAIQQVKDNESSDEDTMYMGCDDDGYVEAV